MAEICSSLKPQLWVPAAKASDAVEFYKEAFGAEELNRSIVPRENADPILCAELKLGPSIFLVYGNGDETAKPAEKKGSTLCKETDDIDGAVSKAVNAGAVVETTTDKSARFGSCVPVVQVKDPFGYVWDICNPLVAA